MLCVLYAYLLLTIFNERSTVCIVTFMMQGVFLGVVICVMFVKADKISSICYPESNLVKSACTFHVTLVCCLPVVLQTESRLSLKACSSSTYQ